METSRCQPICFEPKWSNLHRISAIVLQTKFASNFCCCAVDQENAVFQWKRAVSGPSALLGLEMVKFASNFCCCAVGPEKAVFQWKRAISGPSAFWGPEMDKFASNFYYCVDKEKAVFSWKWTVSGPSAL